MAFSERVPRAETQELQINVRCVVQDDDSSAGGPAKDGDGGVGECDAVGGVQVRCPWAAAGAFRYGAEAGGWGAHDGRESWGGLVGE